VSAFQENCIGYVITGSKSLFIGMDEKLKKFYWQNGYGAFSVNPHQIDVARSYIQRQHQHHKSKIFQDEFRAFLKKYQVKYDERYVWD
jgi:putative transposase